MRIFILLSIVSILIACNNEKEKSDSVEKQNMTDFQFDLPKSEYVILPLDSSIDWMSIFKKAKPSELSQSELTEIEEIIKVAIKENNKKQKEELINHNNTHPENQWTETGYELKLNGYKRQYVSVINKKGEKEIWINFFCDDWGTDKWKSQLMIVKDGGNCYFNMKVNLTKKTFYELRINGYA